MTSIPTDLKTPVSNASQDTTSPRRSRRKRSLRWMISQYLDRMLRSRQLFNVGLVLLLLAGFVHISLVNDVLGTKDKTSYSYNSERPVINSTKFTGPVAVPVKLTSFYRDPSGSGSVLSASRPEPVVSETPLANTWATGDLRTLRLLPIKTDDTNSQPASRVDDELRSEVTPPQETSVKNTATYVVNEGGSLWRAGKRFIDDEVLLDRLIDNLAQSGMDVRSVSAGAAFIVNDLGNDGLLVTLDDNGDTYEAHIVEGGVKTPVLSVN